MRIGEASVDAAVDPHAGQAEGMASEVLCLADGADDAVAGSRGLVHLVTLPSTCALPVRLGTMACRDRAPVGSGGDIEGKS